MPEAAPDAPPGPPRATSWRLWAPSGPPRGPLGTPQGGTELAATVFGAAPRALAGVIPLQQTVDLVRLSIDVVEASVDDVLEGEDAEAVHAAILRYAREVAFATAEVYARAAEARGAWDARLEALGAHLEQRIRGSGRSWPQIQRVGSICWLYFDDGPLPPAADGIAEVHVRRFNHMHGPLLNRGLYLPPSAYEVLFLSTAHTVEDIDELADAVLEACEGLDRSS